MWNTMECKRDSSNGSLGGASEIHWECVSHCLKALTKNQASTSVTGCTYTRSSLTISFYEISSGSLFTRLAIAIVVVFFFLLLNSLFFLFLWVSSSVGIPRVRLVRRFVCFFLVLMKFYTSRDLIRASVRLFDLGVHVPVFNYARKKSRTTC